MKLWPVFLTLTNGTLCDFTVYVIYNLGSDAENLALNQTTWQSSDFEQGFAWKAVDGNMDCNYQNYSHTSTLKEKEAWWMVGLDDEYIVTEVLITNRGEENFAFD